MPEACTSWWKEHGCDGSGGYLVGGDSVQGYFIDCEGCDRCQGIAPIGGCMTCREIPCDGCKAIGAEPVEKKLAELQEQLKDAQRDAFNAEQYAVDLGKRIQLLEAAADAANEFKDITQKRISDVRTWDAHKALTDALKAVASG